MKKLTRAFLLLSLILIFSLLLSSCGKELVIEKIPVDYESMTYVGSSYKDFSALFDEQEAVGDPRADSFSIPTTTPPFYDGDGNGNIDDSDKEKIYDLTVDLSCEHYIECVYVFFGADGGAVTIETGTPFAYENTDTASAELPGWVRIDVDAYTQHVNVKYNNGSAPYEIVLYGDQTGEPEPTPEKTRQNATMGYLLGINGNRIDAASPRRLSCASYFRDYINWGWFYDPTYYETGGSCFSTMDTSRYFSYYSALKTQYNIDPVPCLMFTHGAPMLDGADKNLPESYFMYGELAYQFALRYGNNTSATADMVVGLGSGRRYSQGLINWIEMGNEPNGEDNKGVVPYQLAALTSCAYDGHCCTITAPSGSGVGAKNGDPNIKVAMAGLAGVHTVAIKAMTFWMEYNRADGELAMDAFNVHTYCKKLLSYNGYSIYVGVCPELGEITKEIEKLAAFRDEKYPNTEIWLTEFGWDTNESYETENACHAYGEYSARELQAMWLVRAYFMFASVGVDRAAMFMARDDGDEATHVGKYGTSGVITHDGILKDSFYYISTLNKTMGDMYFAEIIDSGNEDVWIYRFENGEGKSCYALWCPTMDSVSVEDYALHIDGSDATLVEFAYGEESGISSQLNVGIAQGQTSGGTVTVNVSERPILVFSE